MQHSLVLTDSGQVYAMGDNMNGQLGIGSASNRGIPLPTFIEGTPKVAKIRAGVFSALITAKDKSVYTWGCSGAYQPRSIKFDQSVKDIQLSLEGSAALITFEGALYTWGQNHTC